MLTVRAVSLRNGRHVLDRLDGGGEADALRLAAAVLLHQPVEARQRQRQVRAALVVGHGVDLVDDHGADVRQHFARALRRSAG